MILYLACRV